MEAGFGGFTDSQVNLQHKASAVENDEREQHDNEEQSVGRMSGYNDNVQGGRRYFYGHECKHTSPPVIAWKIPNHHISFSYCVARLENMSEPLSQIIRRVWYPKKL